jgi:glycosyltransferase involved in cell wall biosynthesis
MRITYLVNEYPKLSHSFIRREICALEEKGVSIQRISLRGRDSLQFNEADNLERDRTVFILDENRHKIFLSVLLNLFCNTFRFFRAVSIALRVSAESPRWFLLRLAYVAEACRVRSLTRSFRSEHVHAHFGSNSAEIAMYVSVLGGPSFSFTVHGQDELFSGGLRFKVIFSRFVVGISSFGCAQLYLRLSRNLWHKVKLVRCGLEDSFFEPECVAEPAGQTFVCVGRLCVEKGHMMLLEACRLLREKGTDFRVVLAGDGEFRREIEVSIQDLGLAAHVSITGQLDSQSVQQLLREARSLVLASFSEGLPVVIMEAFALGKPVISTFVGGIPELVRHGENGWLVAAGSSDDLALAMESCLSFGPEALSAYGLAGRKRCRELHSVSLESEKLLSLFRGYSCQ